MRFTHIMPGVMRTGDTMTGPLQVNTITGGSGAVDFRTTLGGSVLTVGNVGGFSTFANIQNDSVFFPVQAPTASAPAYVEGGMYYDTTLHKLRIGGAAGWETVTSV